MSQMQIKRDEGNEGTIEKQIGYNGQNSFRPKYLYF